MTGFDNGATSGNVTRVNNSTRVTTFGDSHSTRVMLRKMVTRLESRFSQNDSTRVTVSDSRLESESFLQNLLTVVYGYGNFAVLIQSKTFS